MGERVDAMAMQSGQVRREHYAYEKLGSCALLAAIEPLSGKRLAPEHTHRTKREDALFCQALAERYPESVKIRLVQDNLNTHNPSAFYEHLPAVDAFALAQRFEMIYTPKCASWLNMIEIEFSALARGCLHQRIPTQAKLEREVLAFVAEREVRGMKIDWQFSLETARHKVQRHYQHLNPDLYSSQWRKT